MEQENFSRTGRDRSHLASQHIAFAAQAGSAGLVNALTVDVEDYFHVSAFEGVISPSDWDSMPHRVVGNTMRVLELFAEYRVRGTFFVLGWVAEKYPFLVRHIADAGHEIASHGCSHRRLHHLNRNEVREELYRSRVMLEDMTGTPVEGYRAPSWSICSSTLWVLDELIEQGYRYDSSIFPIYHDLYGIPDAPRLPYVIRREGGTLLEFPPTTYRFSIAGCRWNFPIAGGGYLRLLHPQMVQLGIRHVNLREGTPAVLYFHPWEIDPKQPRVGVRGKSRFRHYLNLDKMESRLRYLLVRNRFSSMCDVLQQTDRDIVVDDPSSGLEARLHGTSDATLQQGEK